MYYDGDERNNLILLACDVSEVPYYSMAISSMWGAMCMEIL